MNCSVAVFSFSLCPLQALSADTCRALPKENVRVQGLARGQLLMALRWTVASSSLWPPERKAIPVGNRKHSHFGSENFIHICVKSPPPAPPLTCDRWGNSAAQGSDGCHSSFLWAILGGAAVSSSDHVGFEDRAFQVHMVVRHGFVHCSQDLQREFGTSGIFFLLSSLCHFFLVMVSHTHSHAVCKKKEIHLLSDVLAAFQVMVSFGQNLRLYDGHNAMLAKKEERCQNNTKMYW